MIQTQNQNQNYFMVYFTVCKKLSTNEKRRKSELVFCPWKWVEKTWISLPWAHSWTTALRKIEGKLGQSYLRKSTNNPSIFGFNHFINCTEEVSLPRSVIEIQTYLITNNQTFFHVWNLNSIIFLKRLILCCRLFCHWLHWTADQFLVFFGYLIITSVNV